MPSRLLRSIYCQGIIDGATPVTPEGTPMIETPEYAAMMRRMMNGLGRRVANGDPSDLADAVELQKHLDNVLRDAVEKMREQSGFSWQQLADELGTSRQAVQQRYGARKEAR